MGAAAPQAQSSKVQFDGAMNLAHNIAKTTFVSTAAVDNVSPLVSHGPLSIIKLILNILTSTTTSAKLELGDNTTASAYFGPVNIKNIPAGVYELLASQLTPGTKGLTLQKGDYAKVKALQSTSGSPVFAGVVVFGPASGQSDTATVG